MGEVYRARDTRLERTVAIKVLPAHIASDPDFQSRFEREAKTISQLNHPHICTLSDVGHQGRVDFLVMEYLEGETLADRLGQGVSRTTASASEPRQAVGVGPHGKLSKVGRALPLDDALTYAIQIADALDKAHRQGIVHREPGNVMLTKAGAKLLDFGLAKISGSAALQGREVGLKPRPIDDGLSAPPTAS